MYIFTLCLQDAKTVHRFSQHIIQVDFQCWRNNISKLYDFEDTIYLRIYIYIYTHTYIWASQVVLVAKNLPSNARDLRDTGSIPASGRSPGGGHGNPLEYFCPENPMDRGAWWATVHRVIKSQTRLKRLSKQAYIHVCVCIWCLSLEWAPLVAQTVRNPPAIQETWVRSLDPEDPLEKGMTTHSRILS